MAASSTITSRMMAMDTPEPHKVRRVAITEQHPEVKQLFGPAWSLKYITLAETALQLFIALKVVPHVGWGAYLLITYCVGATIAGSLFLAIHEIAHGHAFDLKQPGGLLKNRLVGFIADAGLLLPVSTSFRRYHLDHHAYQGVIGKDPDLPTEWECEFFTGSIGKLAWLTLQPVFYALRPVIMHPKVPSKWEPINIVVVAATIFSLRALAGDWSAGVYLWTSSVIGASLHPMAAHFVAEHVVLPETDPAETHSYYGSLNWLAFNVGYHNEHHDFPQVSFDRLPGLTELAKEEYEKVSIHLSWPGAMLRFVTDPRVTVSNRVVREGIKGDKKAK